MADELVVLLGPDGAAAGVRDALVDLSAAGLLAPFCWATASSARSGPVEVLRVEAGRRTRTTVRDEMARGHVRRVRVGVVVPLDGGPTVPPEVEGRLEEVTAGADAAEPMTRVRLLVGGPQAPAAPDPERLVREGWHNVFVAPEDGLSPWSHHAVLPDTADVVDLGRHAAPVVAALTGLWATVPDSPLDDLRPAPGVRAARAFYRRVDAAAVEDDLRRRALDVSTAVPVPHDRGVSMAVIDDAAYACHQMAQTVMDEHRHLLRSDRDPVPRPVVTEMDWRKALRHFFRFLWAMLRNRPAQWYESLVADGASALARTVQKLIYGSGASTVEVVVNGRTRRGLTAGWRDLSQVAGPLGAGVAEASAVRLAERKDLLPLWKDFRAAGFTLVDAGRRSGPPPVMVGRTPAVLRSVTACAPSAEQDFTGVPPGLAADVQIARLGAGDVLGARLLHDRLAQRAGDDPRLDAEVGATQQSLAAWERTWSSTYSAQVGRILALWFEETWRNIAGDIATIRAATEAGGVPERRGPLQGWIQAFAVLTVVGLVLGPYLGYRGVVDGWVAALITGVPLVIWAVLGGVGFFLERRRLYRLLAHRDQLRTAAEVAVVNLQRGLEDIGRLSQGYEQYLQWSRLLGAVLRHPFGDRASARTTPTTSPADLPRSTRVAHVQEAGRIEATIAGVRHAYFVPGWLDAQWEAHEAAAAQVLGWNAYTPKPGDRRDVDGGTGDSALLAWANAWSAGAPAAVGDPAWRSMLSHVQDDRSLHDLLTATTVVEPGGDAAGFAAFLARVDETGARGSFVAEHFTPEARAQNRGRVAADGHQVRQGGAGLSRVVVATELGDVLPPYDFRVGRPPDHGDGAVPTLPPDVPRSDDDSDRPIAAPRAPVLPPDGSL